MFDKLDDILIRLEEVLNELNEPTVANDTVRFQKLMKEQSDLQPIADAYTEYKNCKQTVEDSLMMLEEETDEREYKRNVTLYKASLWRISGADVGLRTAVSAFTFRSFCGSFPASG